MCKLEKIFWPHKTYDFHCDAYVSSSAILYVQIFSDGYVSISNYDNVVASYYYRAKIAYIIP